MKISEKYLYFLTKPGRFFATTLLAQESHWALLFLVCVAAVFSILKAFTEPGLPLYMVPAVALQTGRIAFPVAFIGVLIYAWISILVSKPFGGKATFRRAFIVGAYASAPLVLLAFLQTSFIGVVWAFCLAISGMRIALGLPLLRTVIVQAVASCLIGIAATGLIVSYNKAATRHISAEKLLGKPAPNAQLMPFAGDPIQISDYRGKSLVVLDFWATWCAPCRQSLPGLAEVAKEYKDRGVTVLAVSDDDDWKVANEYLQSEKLDLTGVRGTVQIDKEFMVEGLPQSVIIDRRGIVQSVHAGASIREQERLRSEIERCLTL